MKQKLYSECYIPRGPQGEEGVFGLELIVVDSSIFENRKTLLTTQQSCGGLLSKSLPNSNSDIQSYKMLFVLVPAGIPLLPLYALISFLLFF